MKYYIYGLIDPRDYRIRYVGRTTQRMDRRLQHHLGQAKRCNPSQVYDWLRSLPGPPWLVCLETCEGLVKRSHGRGWRDAAEQVEVARSSVDLAEQALAQSQDRFTAGVADNLEVVQAQEALAGAHESYIQSLYAHNLSKVELAYAIGDAEDGVRRYLKGNQ